MAGVKIPKKAHDRLVAGLKKYQRIVGRLRERDVSEADTVTVVKDMLSDVFGYDKYSELTSEQQIRGTFCDLAVKVEGKVYYLAEVKSAGTNLNDNHLRQAVNYGAHHGIEWILLTNAIEWRLHRIKFGQPISYDHIYTLDICGLSARSADDLEKLYMLSRECISLEALAEFHRQSKIVNRFVVAELLQGEAVVGALRKEFRRLFDGLKVSDEDIRELLTSDVIKRDTMDGDPAKAAKSLIKRSASAVLRKQARAAPADGA
jgi:hypothetical protein